jgi:hypothetical protein
MFLDPRGPLQRPFSDVDSILVRASVATAKAFVQIHEPQRGAIFLAWLKPLIPGTVRCDNLPISVPLNPDIGEVIVTACIFASISTLLLLTGKTYSGVSKYIDGNLVKHHLLHDVRAFGEILDCVILYEDVCCQARSGEPLSREAETLDFASRSSAITVDITVSTHTLDYKCNRVTKEPFLIAVWITRPAHLTASS